MNLNPKNFRRFDSESKPDFAIRLARNSPLILVKGDGDALFAKSQGDKDALVAQFNESTDLLLWAWAGQWSTDVFQLTAADLAAHYR